MSQGPIKILVVDDDSEDLMLVAELVEAGFHNSGVTIDKANSYDAALVLLQNHGYDVVLIDYYLAEKTGIDLLQAIKSRQPEVSVILVSGQGTDEVAVQAMKLGAADYLVKGRLTEALLIAAIRYAVGLSEREAERKNNESEMRRMNEELGMWARKLERRTQQSALIQELGAKLQICLTSEEAYQVVGESLQKLFPKLSGTLSIARTKQNLYEEVVRWGEGLTIGGSFFADRCRALRRGRSYTTRSTDQHLMCGHLTHRNDGYSICIPLAAQGETLGLFTLQSGLTEETQVTDEAFEEFCQLSETVSEDIALSLANLKLRENLRIQSVRDSLTGLFNRRYMEESLERELSTAGRKDRKLSVILMDVDRFKIINDTMGHDFGDLVLADVGSFLLRNSRGSDIACRYGGDEFVLILPEVSLEVAKVKIESLRTSFNNLALASRTEAPIKVSLSMGVSAFPENGSTARELLIEADKALYRLKASLPGGRMIGSHLGEGTFEKDTKFSRDSGLKVVLTP
ncbi:MAG: diguanylate cyclase [Candidatus Acidiferrum sp.]|jgi:diguanylate cyclase (GGDEF)-like protein